jgi:Fic family protein
MIAITPYIDSSKFGEYQDKILELHKADAALNQTIPSSIRSSTEWLLKLVNCFYSNKIEGNSTHPKDLLRSQEKGEHQILDSDDDSILELLAHLEAQIKIKESGVKTSDVVTQAFIKKLHKSFYNGLPDSFLSVKDKNGADAIDGNGKAILIHPGEYRTNDVQVSSHIPPKSEDLNGYMQWLETQFSLDRIHGTNKVIAAAALHHRLAWIHAFQDGNGRVIRLLTDCYMRCAGFDGYGLWSITRGFGRNTRAYYEALAKADRARNGNYDGRGTLSDSGVIEFTKYFVDTALDQVKYFSALLEPRNLGTRVDIYFEMRAKGALPDSEGNSLPIIKITARDIYRLLLDRGSMNKRAICSHIGKGEQTLRPIFKQMQNEGLINAKPKQDVELNLSTTSVEVLFPQLW